MTESEKQFYSEADNFFDELMHDFPTLATYLGDHRFDDSLGIFTHAAIADQRCRAGKWLSRFECHDTVEWSIDSRIDQTILVQLCKSTIRAHDKIRSFEKNPNSANEVFMGIDSLINREFAPLPDRLNSVLMRLGHVPRVLKEIESIIKPFQVPEIWADVALQSASQGKSIFTDLIPSLAVSAPSIQKELLKASEKAASAIDEHCLWLKNVVIPQAKGDFVAGKNLFEEILREDHLVDYNAEELRKIGWQIYEETMTQLNKVAYSIDPHKSVMQLLEENKSNHPSAENLLDIYRELMSKARRFVIEKKIVTIPEGECIRVEPTPPYERAILPYAAYSMPGFFDKMQEGIFLVTPADDHTDPEVVERKLRGHPWSDIPTTVVHEAYPGHHLQLVVSNKIPSIPRKLSNFLSMLFIEGWAFYCEELMEKLGFTDQPIQKLGRLQGQLWRACRIIIDVSLHTDKMTIENAIQFLIERAALEPDDAKAEVLRYTQNPTQPQSYLMGKLQLLDIIDEYKIRFPKATMMEMHDTILQCGSLPPRLMKMRLFSE